MLSALALALMCGFFATPAHAQDYSQVRIVRLSFIEGSVQYKRPGEDWQDAKLNLPIQQGFALQTGNGYVEVEFEHGSALRLAQNSSLDFTELALLDGNRQTRIGLTSGTAIISADIARKEQFSIDAANLNLTVPRNGRFRVDASPAETWVTVFNGKVELPQDAPVHSIGSGHSLRETGGDPSSLQIVSSPPKDDFDKWVSQRDDAIAPARQEVAGMFNDPYYTVGFADMDFFGTWMDMPGYGLLWQPYGMGLGWTPFLAGQWMFMGPLGWNWASTEPWGWLPYHFGSWVNEPGLGWMWAPIGPMTWRPATATWVRVNNQLGWTPLAPPAIRDRKITAAQAAAPRPVIFSDGAATGPVIRAGKVISTKDVQTAGNRLVAAGAPAYVPNRAAAARTEVASLPTGAPRVSSFADSGHPIEAHAPALTGAPRMSASAFAGAHPMMTAPRSAPVNAAALARMSGGSGGGFSGARVGGFGGAGGAGRAGGAGGGMSAAHSGSVSAGHASSGRSSGGHR